MRLRERSIKILSMNATRILYILTILADKLLTPVRKYRLNRNIQHLHGKSECSYAIDELVVLCVVRDGEFFIKTFIEYYFSIGVKHIFFIDNGSTDKTVSIIKKYDNITLLRCILPFKKYKFLFKRYLIDRFCEGRWSLCVDIDEFFDYPYSDRINLQSFLSYLNAYSCTAVTTQMLDMFSSHPINRRIDCNHVPLTKVYRYYDISAISKKPYKSFFGRVNCLTNNLISVHLGGVRKKAFGLEKILLTKHSLIFLDKRIKTFYKEKIKFFGSASNHGVSNAKVGDVSCVLYHYKFHSKFYKQTQKAVREKNYSRNSYEYKCYLKALDKNLSLKLKNENSLMIKSVNELIDIQFIVISKRYKDWIKRHTVF